LPDNLSKAGLQRIYGPKFHKSNLHHLIPKTRNGQGTEYNLFPYSIRSHGAYHDVFLNLRINEVWEMFNRIHSSIFEPEEDYIVPWWIEKCKREIGTADEIASFNRNKKNRMAKTILNSLVEMYFSKAIKIKGKIGKEYLAISLWATKEVAARKVKTKNPPIGKLLSKNNPPRSPKIKI